jgi:hypothetical protein
MPKTPARRVGQTGTTETVDASPSKSLFIDMLVRDIELRAAIGDLVDNSVDGARRVLGSNGAKAGKGLGAFSLAITVARDRVALHDNCGGISLPDAREYAFKFGRPKGVPGVDHSIGQFGVGMKRAFFKLGRVIDLKSVTTTSRFALHLPVDDWADDNTTWEFKLTDVVEAQKQPKADIGTRIDITGLLPSVADEVGDRHFPHELLDELAQLHREAIGAGFGLEVNGIRAYAPDFVFLRGAGIVPASEEYLHENGGAPVRVRIASGVVESAPGTAGWDVACNGRTVLKSDQTSVTGWRAGGDVFIPSYHNQFARFRGIVMFDSIDAGRVPWNTTKTHLDQDSDVWREAKRRMIAHMRPIIDFLNALDREKDQEGSESTGPTLASAVQAARPVALDDLAPSAIFRYPTPAKAPKVGRVTFYRPRALLQHAVDYLDVGTYREVGEAAFDYWVEAELDEDE